VHHSEDRVCTHLDGIRPHVKVLTQTYLRAFLGSPTEAKTFHCGIFPTPSLALLQGCALSQSAQSSLIGCAPTRRITSTSRRYVPPRGSVNEKMPMFLSRWSWGAEILYCEIFPIQNPPLCCKDVPFSEPLSIPLMGCAPTWTDKPTGSLHLNLWMNEPMIVFLYQIPSIFR